ncbi:6-bladed beta-propeller [Parabacteroides pacaensis]|uniref:6-bladed beta-propeller n=1 Tax=Parabacteroides pacaensis TaxID=2086575 RepID=UPI000D0F8059|nr:6-bladed beta-propeller [Parabacteroides pacaensis]
MKRLDLVILVLVTFIACNQKIKLENTFVESIPIDLDKTENKNLSDFVRNIELVPLYTDINCLVSTYNKFAYYKEIGMFLIMDKDLVVSLFSKEGQFIASSKAVMGVGPGEYRTAVDAIYNPYTKNIEILTPYGKIYRYDTSFHFVEEKSLEQSTQVFARFVPLQKNKYVLTPVILGDKDIAIYFCDYDQKEIGKPIRYDEDYISSLTMNYNPFLKLNNDLYFSPLCFNYMFYKILPESQQLQPIMKLDFGSHTVHKKDIVNRFGTASKTISKQEDRTFNYSVMDNVNNYLLENTAVPAIKFFNEKYVYVLVLKNGKRITYIYDRKTKRSYMQTNENPIRLSFCLDIDDTVLFAAVQPYELEKLIDIKLLDEKSKQALANIQEDDNPIIVKYYLR